MFSSLADSTSAFKTDEALALRKAIKKEEIPPSSR